MGFLTRGVRVFSFVALTLFMVGIALDAKAQEDEFCWKDSYGRGVGKIPKACRSDEDRIGLLCYKKCPKGTKRFGFDCHSVCPAGWRNDGLFCRHAEYGRGAGYPWKFKYGLKHPDDKMRAACERDHGKGKCEKTGAIFYPKCKPGYHRFGCCICRPSKPNCKALGLKNGIDLSCAKVVKIGHPKTGQCKSNEEKNAGLCYKKCRKGFKGVGPVCWGDPPKGWVNCGMGSAKDKKACRSAIADQVMSVGELAINVATLGTSSAVTEAAEGPEKAREISKLEKMYEEMKDGWDALKASEKYGPTIAKAEKAADKASEVQEVVDGVQTTYDAVQTGVEATTPEDYARMGAMIASLMDPSGVSSVVAAYTYPKCSKYFK